MKSKTNGFSIERLLTILIIGVGCLGLSYAFHAEPTANQNQGKRQEIALNGSFTVDAPIRFTLNYPDFNDKSIEIDFGNGTQRVLKDSSFTFAYRKEGQYILKIKQNNRVLYRRTVYITNSDNRNENLIVMN